jgi:hypothetical protein
MAPEEVARVFPGAALSTLAARRLLPEDAGVTTRIGALVGAVFNASSSWYWASLGKGRSALFLFEGGLLAMETNLRGSPLGGEERLRRFGDMDLAEAGDHVDDLAALDSRNLVMPVEEVESARLSSRRPLLSLARVVCLEVRLRGGRRHTSFWVPRSRYYRMRPDGALARPRGAYDAAVADMERVFGSRLTEEPRPKR